MRRVRGAPTSSDGEYPKIRRTASLIYTIRLDSSMTNVASGTVLPNVRNRSSLARSADSLAAAGRTRPGTRPRRHGLQQLLDPARAFRAERTPAPPVDRRPAVRGPRTRCGARRLARRRARGKLASLVTSVIHAGCTGPQTRPGSPSPDRNEVWRPAARNAARSAMRLVGGAQAMPHMDLEAWSGRRAPELAHPPAEVRADLTQQVADGLVPGLGVDERANDPFCAASLGGRRAGGQRHPIVVQSMTNTDTADPRARRSRWRAGGVRAASSSASP
jgi:hypothetical protein